MKNLETGDQADLGSIVLGLGCKQGAASDEVIALAECALSTAGVVGRSLRCIASLNVRAAEPALLAAAMHFAVPLRVFDAATLEAETERLQNPSPIVFALTGCHGVAEAAALVAAETGGHLIVPKMKSGRATAAVAAMFCKQAQTVEVFSSKTDSASSHDDSTVAPFNGASVGIAS